LEEHSEYDAALVARFVLAGLRLGGCGSQA